MRLSVDVLLAVVALVLLLAVGALVLVVRRRVVTRGGPVVDCLVRLIDTSPAAAGSGGWHTGMARYDADAFRWWRVFRLQLAPTVRLERAGARLTHRRPPSEAEHGILDPGVEVFGLTALRGTTEIALARQDVPGFLAWMESAPPGSAV